MNGEFEDYKMRGQDYLFSFPFPDPSLRWHITVLLTPVSIWKGMESNLS